MACGFMCVFYVVWNEMHFERLFHAASICYDHRWELRAQWSKWQVLPVLTGDNRWPVVWFSSRDMHDLCSYVVARRTNKLCFLEAHPATNKTLVVIDWMDHKLQEKIENTVIPRRTRVPFGSCIAAGFSPWLISRKRCVQSLRAPPWRSFYSKQKNKYELKKK